MAVTRINYKVLANHATIVTYFVIRTSRFLLNIYPMWMEIVLDMIIADFFHESTN